jgi:hypothetical protein
MPASELENALENRINQMSLNAIWPSFPSKHRQWVMEHQQMCGYTVDFDGPMLALGQHDDRRITR